MKLNFTHESRDTLKSFTLFITVKAMTKLNLGHRNNARTQLLFFSLNLLFSDVSVAVAVAVAVFLNSVIIFTLRLKLRQTACCCIRVDIFKRVKNTLNADQLNLIQKTQHTFQCINLKKMLG